MLTCYYNLYQVEELADVSNSAGAVIGKRVQELRLELGISQRMLGERAKTSGAYISQLEAGLIPGPTIRQLRKIATGLKVKLEQITGDELPIDEKTELELRAERIAREWLALPDKEAQDEVENFLNYQKRKRG